MARKKSKSSIVPKGRIKTKIADPEVTTERLLVLTMVVVLILIAWIASKAIAY